MDRLKRNMGYSVGFGVHEVGRSGGLFLLWADGLDVNIQSYSKGHIDATIGDGNGRVLW